MSYKSDAEKLQMFLNCIQEMTSIALALADSEGELITVREYLEYVACITDAESYEDWKSSSQWQSSSSFCP
jgi:hypothetical protein